MQNFAEFSERFRKFVFASNSGFKDAIIEDFGRPREPFIDNITKCLDESRMFLINNKIKKLLCLTKTPKSHNSDLRLPFETIFLDVRFSREEAEKFGFKFGIVREVVGIILNQMVVNRNEYKENGIDWVVLNDHSKIGSDDEDNIGIGIRASVLCIEDSDKDEEGAIMFSTFNFPYLEVDNETKKIGVVDIKISKPVRKFIQTFSFNFLNFLYERDVEYVFNDYNLDRLRKRKEKGKFTPISIGTIKILGTLKKYIDSVAKESFEYSHKFWVMGHYKFLQSEKFKHKRFQRVYVIPHIKGKGLLIDKARELEDKGDTQ